MIIIQCYCIILVWSQARCGTGECTVRELVGTKCMPVLAKCMQCYCSDIKCIGTRKIIIIVQCFCIILVWSQVWGGTGDCTVRELVGTKCMPLLAKCNNIVM